MLVNRILETVNRFIRKNNLISAGDRLLLALSGGPDSVFLLFYLNSVASELGFQLGVAHLDHSLRGEESQGDLLFCENLCKKYNLPFYPETLDVKNHAAINKLSIEEAAREMRYDFLHRVSYSEGYNKIVTAHNKDDNAETILYNILKGTGLAGASGIPVRRDNIIRPLLSISKAEILEYLDFHEISYRIDSSNLGNDYTRNYIRNELLPLIKERINPGVEDALCRHGEIISSAKKFIHPFILEAVEQYISIDGKKLLILDKLWLDNGELIFSEAVKYAFDHFLGKQFSFEEYLNLKTLSSNLTGKQIDLKEGFVAHRERDGIVITKFTRFGNYSYEIKIGEEKYIPEAGITIKIEMQEGGNISFLPDYELISANNIDDIFILRNWNFGDKFIPLGMRGFKNISDFLNEQKLNSFSKKGAPVLTNRNNIVYVVGLRIDERYKLKREEKKYCKIWIKRDDH